MRLDSIDCVCTCGDPRCAQTSEHAEALFRLLDKTTEGYAKSLQEKGENLTTEAVARALMVMLIDCCFIAADDFPAKAQECLDQVIEQLREMLIEFGEGVQEDQVKA